MKYLSILAWWLLLLVLVQGFTLVLDHFHHFFWGFAGISFLRICYLGFACILFFRFLSFRAQKNYESMVDAYNRIVTGAGVLSSEKIHKASSLNAILLLVLVVISTIDITLVFFWNLHVLYATIFFDTLIWIITLRYVSRTYRLKALGRREKIKAFLDDSRSKMKSDQTTIPDLEERRHSGTPFLILASGALFFTLGLSGWRWFEAKQTFLVNDLKTCMDKAMDIANRRYYQEGRIDFELAKESCISEKSAQINFTLDLFQGEVYLRGSEKLGQDFFGNGKLGDEGLVLDPRGRFREIWPGSPTQ